MSKKSIITCFFLDIPRLCFYFFIYLFNLLSQILDILFGGRV